MKVTAILVCMIFLCSLCFGQGQSAELKEDVSSVELVSKLKDLKKQNEVLKQKRIALRVKYTDVYIGVVEISAKIAEVEKQIADVSNRIQNSGANEAIELIVLITSLKKRLQLCGYLVPEEQCGEEEIKKKLAEAYQKAVQNPEVLNLLLEDEVEKFEIPKLNR